METHLYPKKNTQAFPSEADKQDKVILQCCTLKIRGGVERDSQGKKAGKGPLIQWEKSATLGVTQDQTLFVFKGGCNKPQCQWKRMENECQLYPECDRCTRNSV